MSGFTDDEADDFGALMQSFEGRHALPLDYGYFGARHISRALLTQ